MQAGANVHNTQALATGQSTLGQLGTATPVGPHAVAFSHVRKTKSGSNDDIMLLEDGYVLVVPGPMKSAAVLGEVQSAASIVFDRALARDD